MRAVRARAYTAPTDAPEAVAVPPGRAREGIAPRHLVVRPHLPCVLVLNELSATVMSGSYDPETGAIVRRQEIPSLPDTVLGLGRACEIEISPAGRFVCASNRGHEPIATFAVDHGTGRLSPWGWIAADVKTPRFFTLGPSGTCLPAANEDSDTIVSFSRDERNGSLSEPEVVIRTSSPTCISLPWKSTKSRYETPLAQASSQPLRPFRWPGRNFPAHA